MNDFVNSYMHFHTQRLFSESAAPKGFSHAVRREGFSPEGHLSLETADGQPLPTMVNAITDAPSMKVGTRSRITPATHSFTH